MCHHYQSTSFDGFLNNHTWDKHASNFVFSHTCGMPSCTVSYIDIQSYRRHIKQAHVWFWFYELHF